jgi:aryl-alcohol dehydrogenase-like predicted oxidoreductase
MSSALRVHYDPVQYFTVVADSSAYQYDDVSWSAVLGSSLTLGAIYRDLGQVAYWDATNSVATPATAPPVVDVRKLGRMTTTGISTATADQIWVSLGTRVKGTPSQQNVAVPPCPIAQIPGVASLRGGR